MRNKARTIRIGLLAYKGAQQSAIFGLSDFFETANALSSNDHEPGGQDPDLATCLEPVVIQPNEDLPQDLQVIVCPPCLQTGSPDIDDRISDWLTGLHGNGALICSICAGAWIVAASGLLDGRRATTHWQLADGLQQAFPAVQFRPDQLLIDDGDVITAGGVMAWTDMGLRLVERFMGPSLMVRLARQFLVEPGRREQRCYSSFDHRLQHGNKAILAVQHMLLKSCASQHKIEEMAVLAGMTERTFQRRFKEATGHTPVSYIQNLRVEKARGMLELGPDSFNAITWHVGYEDASAFQKLFVRIVGLGPQEYRRRFGIADLTGNAEIMPD